MLPMIVPNPSLASLTESASDALGRFSGCPPEWFAAAPGRVNLIGEHTDYNAGWVLPIAIDRYTVLAAAPGAEATQLRVRSLAFEEEGVLSLDALDIPHPTPWMRYLQGVVVQYRRKGIECPALDIAVASSVPPGGGLSSSAALELAMAHLLESVTGQSLSSAARIDASIEAERQTAGVPCGMMDQTVVESAHPEHALLLDCADKTVTFVPFRQVEVTLLVIHSGVSHSLAQSAYAQRRDECERGARALGVSTLREVSLSDLRALDDELLRRRAHHVVSENARVQRSAAALQRCDWDTLGALMVDSHTSLRDDYAVSCDELDVLVRLAVAEAGVYGARLTGGGFGGCVIVLIEPERLEAVAESIGRQYAEQVGWAPTCYRIRSAAGAHALCAAL